MSIKGIPLKYFSTLPKADINTTTSSRQRYEVFQLFLSDDSKPDAATNNAQSKHLTSLFKENKVSEKPLSTIWENTDGFSETI